IINTGFYSIVATVGECEVTDEISITVHTVPVVDLGEDLTICPNEVAAFDVTTAGATYLWHDGSTAATFSSAVPGNISVTVSIGDCSASDEMTLSVVEGAIADLGADAILCEGTILALDVAQPQATYLWENGATTAQRTITEPGTFWVNIYRNDCMDTDTIEVALFDPTLVDLGNDISICPGTSLTVPSPIPNGINTWSTGSGAASITISEAGSYWLNVDLDGCVASDTIEITMIELTEADLGDDRTICTGEEITLSIDPGIASILWSTGENTDSITVSETGTYTVTLESQGCISEDSMELIVMEPITMIDLGDTRPICPDEVIVLDASLIIPAEHLWNTGSTGPVLEVSVPGIYSVTVTGQCVDAIGTVIVIEGDCGPVVHVPNSFTPNNDGINDIFRVSVDGDLANFRLEIFDRWGELIFSTTKASEGWDGSVKGTAAQDGAYIWKLFHRSGIGAANSERAVGHVTLLR
ncbi:MAG: gliding motility-associated C-terminal domain-containing protein, partial [Bacteroidota bacterium]|nr:gliding motility-associated C-terminal domain-containing protein [Bacteroidota bacterium]